MFVAGSQLGTGYFRNAGQTQRLGLELALAGQAGPLRWRTSYSLLRATFESRLQLPGGAHPDAQGAGDADGAVLDVAPGDRMPGLPAHNVKAGVDLEIAPGLELGISAIAQSGQPFRGDEANLLADVPGFVVLGARASYQLLDQLELFAQAENLLDNEYETFGVIADPSQVLPDDHDPRFLSPGAPLGVWVGVALSGP